MHSNASGSRSTSGGTISISTRGSSTGRGLRTGLHRVCSFTSCFSTAAAAASASDELSAPAIAIPRIANESWASFRGRRSAFCPSRPRRKRSFSSFRCNTSFRYSSRSPSTFRSCAVCSFNWTAKCASRASIVSSVLVASLTLSTNDPLGSICQAFVCNSLFFFRRRPSRATPVSRCPSAEASIRRNALPSVPTGTSNTAL